MKSSVLTFFLISLLSMGFVVLKSGALALTCPDIEKPLMQCVQYLTGGAPAPPPACCNGVRQIKAMVTTTEERRFACNCAKQAASRYPNLKDDALRDLPNKCGTPISFPISKTIDCSTIR